MKVMFLGDIVGKPGRGIIKRCLPDLRKDLALDAVIANGENSAGGSGLTPDIARDLLGAGIDILTTGDHVWKKREIYPFLDANERLLRPLNYPAGAPGKGSAVIELDGTRIGVINLIGRVFMDSLDCPFVKVREELKKIRKVTNIILVDIHAEATSEKVAMGWFLDGAVSAVVGTHTHVQTADEKVLPGGTAYITDLGMTGPCDSVIGRKKEQIITRFLTALPTRFELADSGIELQGAIIDLNRETGKARSIERIKIKGDR